MPFLSTQHSDCEMKCFRLTKVSTKDDKRQEGEEEMFEVFHSYAEKISNSKSIKNFFTY